MTLLRIKLRKGHATEARDNVQTLNKMNSIATLINRERSEGA